MEVWNKVPYIYIINSNVNKMTTTISGRIRKSEKLSPEDFRQLVRWVNSQPTKTDAAEIIGISRPVLDRLMLVKSSSPETIGKVLKVLRKDDGTDTMGEINPPQETAKNSNSQ